MNFIADIGLSNDTAEMERDSHWLCGVLEKNRMSEKYRRFLQELAMTQEILYTLKDSLVGRSSQYFFGSYVEGTYTKDMNSDKDFLICHEFFPVIDQPTDIKSDTSGSLMVRDENSPAGYVKLQIIKEGCLLFKDDAVKLHSFFRENAAIDKQDRLVWTDVPCVMFSKVEMENRLRQGPSWRTDCRDYFHIDHVYAMRCKSWPVVANEWLARKREYNWPSEETISELNTLGCFLVKASHASSIEKDLEWRISFSLQERHLMCNLNDTQFKCYVVLKILKKDLIERAVGDIISSYHCKTCLFYTIEQNPLEIWRPQNLLYCVNLCLQFLKSCIKKQFCPNYFIPKENMFEGRITDQNKRKIEVILTKKLINKGRKIFLSVRTAKMNKHLFNYENNPAYAHDISLRYSVEDDIIIFQTTTVAFVFRVFNQILLQCVKPEQGIVYDSLNTFIGETIQRLATYIENFTNVQQVTEHTRIQTDEAKHLIIPLLHMSIACNKVSLAFSCKKKSDRRILFGDSKIHFQKGISSDLTSCRLKHAALRYTLGEYLKCEAELNSIMEDMNQPYVTFTCECRILEETNVLSAFDKKCLPHHLLRPNLSTLEIMRSSVSPCIAFLPTEIPIIPEAMRFELFRCSEIEFDTPINHSQNHWYQWAVIDSKIFLLFLTYLTLRKLNKSKDERMRVIKAMERLLNSPSKYQELKHPETACNLISWILVKEDSIPNAMKYLFQSFVELQVVEASVTSEEKNRKVSNFHNAAKWHLLLILYRIWFSKELNVNFCFNCLEITDKKMYDCEECKVAKYCSVDCFERNLNLHDFYCKLHSLWTKKKLLTFFNNSQNTVNN